MLSTTVTLALTGLAGAAQADPVAASFTIDVPETIHAGDGPTTYSGHLDGGDDATSVFLITTVTGADAAAGNIHLEWKDGDEWKSMVSTPVEGGFKVGFGNGDIDANGVTGFPAPAGYGADTDFRISADADAIGGELAFHTELIQGIDLTEAGTVLDETDGTVDVTVDPSFSLETPASVHAGADWTEYEGHLTAPDGGTNLFVLTDITGPAAAAGKVHLQWFDALFTNTWQNMVAVPVEGGFQVGFANGDADADGITGFSAPVEYGADTQFRIKVDRDAPAGALAFTSRLLQGVDATQDGTELRRQTGSIAVTPDARATFSLALPASVQANGTATEFAGSLADTDGADAAWTRLTFTGSLASKVKLEQRSGDAWTVLTPVVTGNTAVYSFDNGAALAEAFNQTRTYRISVLGTEGGTLAYTRELAYSTATDVTTASGTLTVTAVPVKASATVAAPKTATYGQSIKVTGKVVDLNRASAAVAGQTVDLYRTVAGKATKVASVKTVANGTFSFTTSATATGSYYVVAGSSKSASVSVTVSRTLTGLKVVSAKDGKKSQVKVTGKVASPVKNETVRIEVLQGKRWVKVGTAKANAAGAFTFVGKATKGKQTFRVVVDSAAPVTSVTSASFVVTIK